MNVNELTTTTRDLLPPVCRDCRWWQSAERSSGGGTPRTAWEAGVEREVGLFGFALSEGADTLGVMHIAPSHALCRAHSLPAGPPSADAFLLSCAYFSDESPAAFSFLLREVVLGLVARQVPALEAFCLRRAPATPTYGYVRECNLFQREALEAHGFRSVCVCGEVARLRLDLSTRIAVPSRARGWRRALERLAAQPT